MSIFERYKYSRVPSTENDILNEHVICRENIPLHESNELCTISSSCSSDKKLLPLYDQIVEKEILKGETLRSISVKYRIPVSELKRVNKIQKDAEFFALSCLKIPVKPYSSVIDVIENEKVLNESEDINTSLNSTVRQNLLGISSIPQDTNKSNDIHVGYVSINQILREKETREQAKRFLDNMKEDLEYMRNKTNFYTDSSESGLKLLLSVDKSKDSNYLYSFSWWKLFIAAIVILVVVPLIYIYFIVEES